MRVSMLHVAIERNAQASRSSYVPSRHDTKTESQRTEQKALPSWFFSGLLVLCVDEKSQIQAFERSQPGLPLKRGRAATLRHDYKRHGSTRLFAALDVKTGLVGGECLPRHRAKKLLRFLKRIDRVVKKYSDIHVVVDNDATHKTPEVRAWLNKQPRCHLHYTPIAASSLNLVERFFAEITVASITIASPARLYRHRPP